MWFGEPHPFPERGSPTRLSVSGQQNYKGWSCSICIFIHKYIYMFLCILDRASSWYLNNGWPTRWHLLYYILLNMFQMLIRPSSGASEYLCCVGRLEACWCHVAGVSVGDVISECGSAYTRTSQHQQTIPLHNTSTPQVGLHNTTSTR